MAHAVTNSAPCQVSPSAGLAETPPSTPQPITCASNPSAREREDLSDILANVPAAIFRCRTDQDWTINYISDGIESISGYKAQELMQRMRTYASIVHPDDRDKVTAAIQRAIENGTAYSVEYRLVDPNGQTRWVYEKGRASGRADGRPQVLDGAVLEVTELKQAEDRLLWEAEVNAAISELYKPLISPYSFIDDVARAVLTEALRLTNSTQGYVSVIDAQTGQHTAQALTPGFRRHCVAAGVSIQAGAGDSDVGGGEPAVAWGPPAHADVGASPSAAPRRLTISSWGRGSAFRCG